MKLHLYSAFVEEFGNFDHGIYFIHLVEEFSIGNVIDTFFVSLFQPYLEVETLLLYIPHHQLVPIG